MIPIKDINPTERFAVITVLLISGKLRRIPGRIAAGSGGEAFVAAFALVPARLFSIGRIRTGPSGLGHDHSRRCSCTAGFLHIAGNMLYLWIFGNNIEDSMGRLRFILFYLLCGVIAAYDPCSREREIRRCPMIGASGAVSGVLGAYLLLYPRARVVTLVIFGFYIRTIEVPAMFVLGFWFVLQFLNALLSSGAGRRRRLVCACRRICGRHAPDRAVQAKECALRRKEERPLSMIVPCECGAKLKIDDAKIGPQGVKVRCPRCGNVIPVRSRP